MAKRGAAFGWDPGTLISPDVLLPEQRQFSSGERTGAEALLWAVLMDGIRTYCVATLKRDVRNLAYREAEHWLFGLESDALTAFPNLCRVFDIDPRLLRSKLRDFTREPGAVAAVLDREAA